MKRIKIILFSILIIILVLLSVFLYGCYRGKIAARLENRPAIINSQVVLEKIIDQYFLVTKTVFIDTKAEIETEKNNNWTDLFTGKKLTVLGLIRVDVGVDMNNMTSDNIYVDSKNKIITVTLPQAEILNSSLSGELDLIADKSIVEKLKGILKNTQNEDYNLALQTLISSANSQVIADKSIFSLAREDSAKLVKLIVSGMLQDYEVVIRNN